MGKNHKLLAILYESQTISAITGEFQDSPFMDKLMTENLLIILDIKVGHSPSKQNLYYLLH